MLSIVSAVSAILLTDTGFYIYFRKHYMSKLTPTKPANYKPVPIIWDLTKTGPIQKGGNSSHFLGLIKEDKCYKRQVSVLDKSK